jgi:hypothetical protein
MAERPQQSSQLGATFYPGGQDDFYMPPEVISPKPQRYVNQSYSKQGLSACCLSEEMMCFRN